METTLLCVGDMHLGRRPSRLPEGLELEYGISPRELDPRAGWRAVVRTAIGRRVDAVLLAGDVVESDNGFLEAHGALRAGVEELAREGIDVIAVAGNHDVEVLPRLADELVGSSIQLLGRGGRWESAIVRRGGEPLVRVLGWSFPRHWVEDSPLSPLPDELRRGHYGDDAPDDLRTVGLLHCDLDASGDHFAPVAASALSRLGVSAWFLGHVHGATIASGGRPLGYLGSLVGLDPGETGAHGPWIARSEPNRWSLEQLELSPVRWEELDVPVDDCADLLAVQAAITRAVRELDARISPRFEGTRVVGCRPRLSGRTSLDRRELRGVLEQARELRESIDGVVYFVDKGFDETEPALDLERLARGSDPPALLARRLLTLREGGEEARRLVSRARDSMVEVGDHAHFLSLGTAALDAEEVKRILQHLATRALIELLEQKGRAAPSPDAARVADARVGEVRS